MNLLGVLKRKYENALRKRDVASRTRRQLNMTVDVRLIGLLKRLAAQFTVPRNIIGEHMLEVGCYYLTRAMESEEKTKILHQHLINVHLIDNGINDSEAVLRIGEGGNISQLLVQAEPLISNCRNLQRALDIAKKTGNTHYLEKRKKELLRSAVMFAFWLEEHNPDEPPNGETDGSQREDDLDGQ